MIVPLSSPHAPRRPSYPDPLSPALVFLVLFSGLVALGAVSVGAQPPTDPPEPPLEPAPRGDAAIAEPLRPVDRILAVVNQEPVFESQVLQVIELGLVEQGANEGEAAFKGRVLSRLVDQRLRYQEVGRFGLPGVSVQAIEAAVEEIRARFDSPEAWHEYLRQAETREDELRQIVARQLAVLDYVDQRLGPRVFVGLEDIRTFYRQELVPEMEAQGVTPPPLEDVRETIRELLRERRLNEEIDRWSEELRRDADLQILLDEYPTDLPPVLYYWDRPLEALDQAPRRRRAKAAQD